MAGALGFWALYAQAGWYGVNVLLRRGGSTWTDVARDSPRLSPSMRLALADPPPAATAGPFAWHGVAPGFEVAELPVLAGGVEADRILLARLDPHLFRFEARSAPAGDMGLDAWMRDLGAVLVINGSYYGRHGNPDTPFLSDGAPLGPPAYTARHGAFVAGDGTADVVDLIAQPWQAAFAGARDAMVSYPLLLASDGSSRVQADRRWLANRSFVARDTQGRIVLGTTQDAFFSLDRLAAFLHAAPLGLAVALNLDGGPVACQAVRLAGFERRFCGRWETQTTGDTIRLLGWRWGDWALPIVLAAVPR